MVEEIKKQGNTPSLEKQRLLTAFLNVRATKKVVVAAVAVTIKNMDNIAAITESFTLDQRLL